MQHKKKICNICNLPKRIFSKGSCLECSKIRSNKISTKKHRPLRKIADKQKQILRKYTRVRKKYLAEHKLCQIGLPDCTRIATEIHHSGKKYSEELWLNTSLFVSVCRTCHDKIENSPALAKKLGIYNFK